ncbi:hypothetical protein HYC85_019795 [Camellia sinensis]|uniref:BZIP domain-containing protein n=1 Tax=Camellia sinensis TaxID=4442 RepID=A0A7J7GMZ3_CAMSI|nr:hypothetical protein HYC85_019795 [Camellia sinensis]
MRFISRPTVPAAAGCFTYTMDSSNRLSNLRTSPYPSRPTMLPPIGSLTHPFWSYANSHIVGSEAIQKPMEGQSRHHQRSSSENFLLEQPFWLDDLLNEPETLVQNSHRRSASDSSAYLGPIAKTFNTYGENNLKNPRDGISCQATLSSSTPEELEGLPSTAVKKGDQEDSGSQNQEGSAERSNSPQTKPSASKPEAKRAKQQSAYRSCGRKLQYIVDLERNIQVLQAVGSKASSELEFLDQQNLILGMENRALRQRLDSLSQVYLIKHLEQDVLQTEIARLQTLYQLQQQQQQKHQHSKNYRKKSPDFDGHFVNLSIKNSTA